MHAPPKSDDPIITAEQLKEYDGYLFGIPTRFGMMASQARDDGVPFLLLYILKSTA